MKRLLLLPLALMLSVPAFAGKDSKAYKDITEAKSLNHLHHMNQKEIEISNMAQEKAQSQEVKDLANTIAQDHKKYDKKLQETAKSMNIELEGFSPATYEKVVMDKMKELEGKQFDQAYLTYMDEGHKSVLKEAKNIIKELDNDQVSTYVDNLKPELKKHDEMTSEILKSEKFAE